MTAITDFTQIAEILLGRTPTTPELQRVGAAVAAQDPFNLGAWFTYWDVVIAAVVQDAGAGYQMGDLLTVAGGIGTSAVLVVVSTTNGAIEELGVQELGQYTEAPTSPVTLTGGSGTGATAMLGMDTSSTPRIPSGEEQAQLVLDSLHQFILTQLEVQASADKREELDVARDAEIQTAVDTATADFL
jgi:hypothetical protein